MSEEMTKETIHGLIEPVEIDHEMRTAYIDYSMSVIVSGPCRMSGTVSSRSSAACCSEWTASG